MPTSRVFMAAVAPAALIGLLAGCTTGSPVPLGDLGAGFSYPSDVNASGVVVGWADTVDHRTLAFRAAPGQPLTPMPALPGRPVSAAQAMAVNGGGDIVGVQDGYSVVWHADGRITSLPPVVVAGLQLSRIEPSDIDDRGLVVGGVMVGVTLSRFVRYPAVWNPRTGGITYLARQVGTAKAINARGQIVGSLVDPDSQVTRAVVWNPNGSGGWAAARTLPTVEGTMWTIATAINDHGVIVGEVMAPDPGDDEFHLSHTRAVAWRSPDAPDVTLIPLPGVEADAAAVNGAGVVVGSVFLPDPAQHAVAFRWTISGTGVDLLPGLSPEGNTFARAINDAGTIVGDSQTSDGRRLGVRWTR